MTFHPTLWRTCRVLAGETRLRLFRLVVTEPGQTVTALAHAADIKISRASQELRRLQSRGLIRAKRERNTVKYLPVSDPLVPVAKPLLTAMKSAFAHPQSAPDSHAIEIATALSHPRRIAIIQELLKAPQDFNTLRTAVHIPSVSLYRHLELLQHLNLVRQTRRIWGFIPNAHPLTQCLIRILREETDKPGR